MAGGIFLLYISWGVWTLSKWKLKLRLALYGAFTAIIVPSGFLATHRMERGDWLGMAVLVVVLVMSVLHWRFVVKSPNSVARDGGTPLA